MLELMTNSEINVEFNATQPAVKIGFIGLGAMGFPMAGHLAQHFETWVWNRTPIKVTEHAKMHGSTVVSTLEEFGQVDLLFTCLPTTTEVIEVAAQVLHGLNQDSRLKTWIDCTSGHPQEALLLASSLSQHGISFLDAPLSGGTVGAHNAKLTSMVGGSELALEQALPALKTFAAKIVRVGDVGAGYTVKAIHNVVLAINLWGIGEGLTTLSSLGVDVGAALEVINHANGRSFASEKLVPERVLTRAFPATFKLGLLSKDIGIAVDMVGRSSASTPMILLAHSLFKAAKSQIGADQDHTAALKLLEQWAGIELKT